MRELIRDDEKREAQEELEAFLLEGLQGEAQAMTPEEWTAIRKDALAALKAPKPGR